MTAQTNVTDTHEEKDCCNDETGQSYDVWVTVEGIFQNRVTEILGFSSVDVWESVEQVVVWGFAPIWALENVLYFSQCVSYGTCCLVGFVLEYVAALCWWYSTIRKGVVGFQIDLLLICVFWKRAVGKWAWTNTVAKIFIRSCVQIVCIFDQTVCRLCAVSFENFIWKDFGPDSQR